MSFAHTWTMLTSALRLCPCREAVLLLLLCAARLDAGQVTLAWDQSVEPNIVGYTVLYGTRSGNYTASVDVGFLTQYTLTNLPNGTWYFAVQAYNQEGIWSAPSNEVAATIGSCSTPDPFAGLGGGTCYNGGWLPPGMPIPGGGSISPSSPAPAPAPAPAPSSSTPCTTPDPFAGMGGGTCYNGGWLPPGMPIPNGGTVSTSAPAPAPAPSLPTTCATPDPFVGISGLIGLCVDGGWIPVEGIRETGVVSLDSLGAWVIAVDGGETYLPIGSLPAWLQSSGTYVSFSGVPQGTQDGYTLIQIVTITGV